MKKQKINSSVFDSQFSEVWREENTNCRFRKNALDCKRMIREFTFWRLCCLLSILANLTLLFTGAILLYNVSEHVIEFRIFMFMYISLEGLLIYNLVWLTKGEGKISEDRIPGNTAKQLVKAWDIFLKAVKKTDLLKKMSQWSNNTSSSYFGRDELINFFKFILKEKGHNVQEYEVDGKEEKRKLERERMSEIYSIAETLKISRDPFSTYFSSNS